MDRFLLAENPIKKPNSNEYNPLYIIHTLEPKCIIEAICLNENFELKGSIELPYAKFEHKNTDGAIEEWVLAIRDIYSTASTSNIEQLLPRAWRWYRSCLEWEDKNIDIQEDGKWN